MVGRSLHTKKGRREGRQRFVPQRRRSPFKIPPLCLFRTGIPFLFVVYPGFQFISRWALGQSWAERVKESGMGRGGGGGCANWHWAWGQASNGAHLGTRVPCLRFLDTGRGANVYIVDTVLLGGWNDEEVTNPDPGAEKKAPKPWTTLTNRQHESRSDSWIFQSIFAHFMIAVCLCDQTDRKAAPQTGQTGQTGQTWSRGASLQQHSNGTVSASRRSRRHAGGL